MLISVLAEGDEVRAVTSLDDRLFVVRCPSEQQIEIYDVVTFTLQTPFFVANLSDDVRGMTSCDVIRCLYVSDCENKSIRRVDVASGRTFSWRTEGKPYGLSTNAAHNVLVTCPHKILEYTYLGLLVRRVELPSDVVLWAWHAIQLAAGRFVVNHLHVSSQHRVCIVDAMGRIVVQGQVPGSLTGQISSPLAVDKNGLVLVADSDNHRIMVLNPRLEWSQDLQIDADSSGIQGPCALHLDESRGRLYVGESADGRILVFDGVA
jgi:hypothetical protein